MKVISACNIPLVKLLFRFDVLGGVCGEESCNVFMLLFVVLWVPIFTTLCKKAIPMLWHAFIFLGLKHVDFFPPSSFLLGGLQCL
jgi:hypothetical protein